MTPREALARCLDGLDVKRAARQDIHRGLERADVVRYAFARADALAAEAEALGFCVPALVLKFRARVIHELAGELATGQHLDWLVR